MIARVFLVMMCPPVTTLVRLRVVLLAHTLESVPLTVPGRVVHACAQKTQAQ